MRHALKRYAAQHEHSRFVGQVVDDMLSYSNSPEFLAGVCEGLARVIRRHQPRLPDDPTIVLPASDKKFHKLGD